MQKYCKSHGPKNHKCRRHSACVWCVCLRYLTPSSFPLKWTSLSQVSNEETEAQREEQGESKAGCPSRSLSQSRKGLLFRVSSRPLSLRAIPGKDCNHSQAGAVPHFPVWVPLLLPLDTHPPRLSQGQARGAGGNWQSDRQGQPQDSARPDTEVRT